MIYLACFFNSLIQSYFFNPRFVKEIFSFDFELELPPGPYTTEKYFFLTIFE